MSADVGQRQIMIDPSAFEFDDEEDQIICKENPLTLTCDTLPDRLTCRYLLVIDNSRIQTLPQELYAGELDVGRTSIREFPNDLFVDGEIRVSKIQEEAAIKLLRSKSPQAIRVVVLDEDGNTLREQEWKRSKRD